MQIYINVWKDKATEELYIEQQTIKEYAGLDGNLVNAIEDYELMGNKYQTYEHTILIDTKKGTCEIIDIEPAVEQYNKREEEPYR